MLTGLATALIYKCMHVNIKVPNCISTKLFLKAIKTSHCFRLQRTREPGVFCKFTSLFPSPKSAGPLSFLPAWAQRALHRS